MRMQAFVVALGTCLALAPRVMAEQRTLSGEQIRDLVAGTTVAFENRQNGAKLRLTFRPGGEAALAITGGPMKSSKGRWAIENRRLLCLTIRPLRQGQKSCGAVIRKGSIIQRVAPQTGEARGPAWTIVTAGPGVARVGTPAGPPIGGRAGKADREAPDIAKAYVRGPALRALVSGTTVSHVSPRSGSAVRMTWRPDGRVDAATPKRTLNGRWRIEGDSVFCLELEVLPGGSACLHLVRRGNRIERYSRRHRRLKGEDWVIVTPGRGPAD